MGYFRRNPHYTIHGREKISLTESEAKLAAKEMGKYPYVCSKCGFYHIGSEGKELKKRRREEIFLQFDIELGERVCESLYQENSGDKTQKLNKVMNKIRSAASARLAKLCRR